MRQRERLDRLFNRGVGYCIGKVGNEFGSESHQDLEGLALGDAALLFGLDERQVHVEIGRRAARRHRRQKGGQYHYYQYCSNCPGADHLNLPGFSLEGPEIDINNSKVDFHIIKVHTCTMEDQELPAWLVRLEDEDYQFIKRFLLASGSLKDLAEQYEVSYPTIRLRMDRLIERIRNLDASSGADAFDAKVRLLVAEGEITPRLGKDLLRIHNHVVNGKPRNGDRK
jgi:hypothetical protein